MLACVLDVAIHKWVAEGVSMNLELTTLVVMQVLFLNLGDLETKRQLLIYRRTEKLDPFLEAHGVGKLR